jgi:hypothetical protein
MRIVSERPYLLCAARETVRVIDALCDALGATVLREYLVERRYKKKPLFLHARLAVLDADGARPCYVLHDRDFALVWQHYATLKYLNTWARRLAPDPFPPVLILATRAHRAEALLVLNRMCGGHVTAYARTTPHGTWHVLRDDNVFIRVDAPLLPVWPMDTFTSSVHRVVDDRGAVGGLTTPTIVLSTIERLDAERYRVLKWLAQHPVCPASTLATLLEMPLSDATAHLDALASARLVTPIRTPDRDALWLTHGPLPKSHLHVRLWRAIELRPLAHVLELSRMLKLAPQAVAHGLAELASAGCVRSADDDPAHRLWRATNAAIDVLAVQHLAPADAAVRRHRFFCADHARRAGHTRAVYAFFERLRRECAQRSAAARRFDALSTINDGDIPQLELMRVDSELRASDWYARGGETRVWRPDGFAMLRAGAAYVPFYLEIDGTRWSRARRTAALWEVKFGALCDYVLSRHWRLRVPEFPRLLIVTTDALNRRPMQAGLLAAARSRGIAPPLVFVCTHDALDQRAILQPIWLRIPGDGRTFVHPFAEFV